jgi:hypothetical protein
MKAHPSSASWRLSILIILIFAASFAVFATLPAQLTDDQFWKLSASLSEQDGEFRSDNLLSNELTFQNVIPELLRTAQLGRVYLGVGPEQNFSYIAALKPSMAFIIDIRHGNMDVHLLYKALFELSANRAEFVSRLFSRKRPASVTLQSSGEAMFDAFSAAESSKALYDANLKAVIDQLKTKHRFPLSEGDLDGIQWAYSNYYRYGPGIYYNSSDANSAPAIVGANGNFGGRRGGGNFFGTTYADLMMADDGTGKERSYLANEENFMVLKNLETKNLLVPVVGDFGGPKAIREVAKYVKNSGGMISAFYLSNVEQYLSQDGKTSAFLSSVATLPIDQSSRFIRSGGNRGFGGGRGVLGSELGNMFAESRPYAGR